MRLRDLAVFLLVPLAFAVLLTQPLFDRLQNRSVDALFLLRHWLAPARAEPDTDRVVVVAIDETTYDSGVEPFASAPSSFWTPAIASALNPVLEGGAAVIGFDLVLSTSVAQLSREPNYERPIRRFLADARDSGKLVLGKGSLGGRSIQPHMIFGRIIRPQNIRSLNVLLDADGVVRSLPLQFRSEDSPALEPSMALELAARGLGVEPRLEGDSVRLGDYLVPAQPDPGLTLAGDAGSRSLRNDLLIDLYGGPASFATYSLADLYLCAQEEDAGFFRRNFAGKIVLFGSVLDVEDRVLTSVRDAQRRDPVRPAERCVLEAAADGHATPPREEIPGIYLHTAAVANLLEGRVLRSLDSWQQFLCAAVLALLVAGIALRVGSATGALAFAGLSIGWIGIAFGGFLAGLVLPLFQPIVAGGLSFAAVLGYRFAVVDRTERHIRQAFGTILAPSLVERMVATGRMPTQGGELREVTVWISDLQNYTTISELLEPPELVRFLNRVYTVMSDTIEAHGGFVAQFVGDAVVAGFNLPLDDPDHARRGIEAALACCREVDALGKGMELPGSFQVRIRVGVSTGELLVGYIGSERRLSYTLVGDDINLASRLEGVNKLYGSQILVNEVTKELCGPSIAFREVDVVRVKGRETPVRIFEPLGPAEAVTEERQASLGRFAEALATFRAQRFEQAAGIFDSLADDDPVAASYAARARAFAAEPPPADWDGVNTLLSK